VAQVPPLSLTCAVDRSFILLESHELAAVNAPVTLGNLSAIDFKSGSSVYCEMS